jgi:hypothetical protein
LADSQRGLEGGRSVKEKREGREGDVRRGKNKMRAELTTGPKV